MKRSLRSFLTGCYCFLVVSSTTAVALQTTDIPPLLNVPTYSLATLNEDQTSTNMNILTYATPVSARPDRIWSIALFEKTKSHENFLRDRTAILQLLTEDHVPIVKLLGGSSGNDVDKERECEQFNLPWKSCSTEDDDQLSNWKVLPNCVYYLRLRAIGDIVNCGSHDVAICKVERMFIPETTSEKASSTSREHLSTARLRELGIITEQGRVAT